MSRNFLHIKFKAWNKINFSIHSFNYVIICLLLVSRISNKIIQKENLSIRKKQIFAKSGKVLKERLFCLEAKNENHNILIYDHLGRTKSQKLLHLHSTLCLVQSYLNPFCFRILQHRCKDWSGRIGRSSFSGFTSSQ